MKVNRVLPTFFCYCLWALSAMSDSFSEALRYDDSAPSNLVAVVAGYQSTRKHESGVEMSWFSLDPGAGDGKETGILFYILAPQIMQDTSSGLSVPKDMGLSRIKGCHLEICFGKTDYIHSAWQTITSRGCWRHKTT